MKKILLISIVTLIAGCTSAAPNYINGRYYMAGDSKCVNGHTNNQGNLVCFNSKKQHTEIRRPISNMQAKAWYDAQKAQAAQPIYQAPIPRQTYCNNIAGVVMCNTY